MSTGESVSEELPSPREFRATFEALEREIAKAVVGHHEAIRQTLIGFFAGGHVLIEGVPGIGKTLIVSSLAQALDLAFARIQFTIDLMPADVTGTRTVENSADGGNTVAFEPGPVFTHVLLADEINRATPKTQSALLEAMAELQVTTSGTTRPLPAPFFVLATLNPIEMEGTYPLPEAQLDRFLFKVPLSYPSTEEIRAIVHGTTGGTTATIEPVFAEQPAAQANQLRQEVRGVLVAPEVETYAARLVRQTIPGLSDNARVKKYVSFGSSPRGAQALILGAKVQALLDGRVNVSYADIEEIAPIALSHRIVPNFAAETDEVSPRTILEDLLQEARKWPR